MDTRIEPLPPVAVPPGFELLKPMDKVMEAMGPIYYRLDAGVDDRHATLAFRVGEHNCNPRGNCHGGCLATFADLQMGINIAHMTNLGGPTISMHIDYMRAAKLGAWVEGRTQLVHRTKTMNFVECLVTADGEPALRASGIFKIYGPALHAF